LHIHFLFVIDDDIYADVVTVAKAVDDIIMQVKAQYGNILIHCGLPARVFILFGLLYYDARTTFTYS
jgi:hypothetical protein